jgi:uncharacterized protein
MFAEGSMRLRLSLPFVPLAFSSAATLFARHSVDPTRARLENAAHMAALTQNDFTTLTTLAQSGNREAQYALGAISVQGRLVEKDYERAEAWFMKSAEKGYAPAERALGLLYRARDQARGAMWLQRAAQKGDAEAQFELGNAYEQGSLGTINYSEALNWLRKSAEQGHPEAQALLGQMYEDCEGVKQNYAAAAKWYRKAGEHVPDLGGAGQGRNNLGLLYMQGQGVPRDPVRAYMWFALAGAEHSLREARSGMTATQILKAQHMADEWKRRHPWP